MTAHTSPFPQCSDLKVLSISQVDFEFELQDEAHSGEESNSEGFAFSLESLVLEDNTIPVLLTKAALRSSKETMERLHFNAYNNVLWDGNLALIECAAVILPLLKSLKHLTFDISLGKRIQRSLLECTSLTTIELLIGPFEPVSYQECLRPILQNLPLSLKSVVVHWMAVSNEENVKGFQDMLNLFLNLRLPKRGIRLVLDGGDDYLTTTPDGISPYPAMTRSFVQKGGLIGWQRLDRDSAMASSFLKYSLP